jgi:glycosyltransferase involved in cell wall biosynthesis
MPIVSICIPTYNHGKFIEVSLHSAMSQTFDDMEIIVLDNASQDNTHAIVASMALRDSRVRYVRHSKNLGLIGNLNACIEFARGKYVKVLCADDRLEPGCISAMVEVLEQNTDVSLVGCARKVTDANLSFLRIAGARAETMRIAGRQMIADCFFWGNRIGEPTAVMFRRADSLRGFSQNYDQLVDMEMWFHLLRIGNFIALPQALCTIRSHAGQATWTNDQNGQIVADRRRLFAEFLPDAAQSAGLFRKCLWDFRMAYAVMRSASAGSRVAAHSMPEVFFPRIFFRLTCPIVKLMRILGLGLVWRTA